MSTFRTTLELCASDKPFEAILVLFTPSPVLKLPDGSRLLMPFYAGRGMLSPLIPGDTTYAKAIAKAARSAAEAQEQGQTAWVTRQYMYLIEILLQVDGFFNDQMENVAPRGTNTIAESVGYILNHYLEAIDGDELARRAGVGRSLYYREFRTLTGLSPHDFVNQLRVQSAMDFLRISDYSIIDIAEKSGFQSLSSLISNSKPMLAALPETIEIELIWYLKYIEASSTLNEFCKYYGQAFD